MGCISHWTIAKDIYNNPDELLLRLGFVHKFK